jgi:hypothetical protein
MFMRNWDERDETGFCNADKDFDEVRLICDKLQIPVREVNFVKDYWHEVFRFVRHSKSFHAYVAVVFIVNIRNHAAIMSLLLSHYSLPLSSDNFIFMPNGFCCFCLIHAFMQRADPRISERPDPKSRHIVQHENQVWVLL